MVIKEIILNVGLFVEAVGNIVLVTAAIFGILSSFIVMCFAHQSNKSENNIIIINTSYSHPINSQKYYEDLLSISASCSLVGLALAIYFQVYWVGITVVTLWLAAAFLSWLGRTIINLAAKIPNSPSTAPSAPPFEFESNNLQNYPVAHAEYYQPVMATVIDF